MAVTFIPGNAGSFSCLSTDIVSGSVVGAKYIGAKIYVEDTGEWYIISTNGGLKPFAEQTITPPEATLGATSLNLTLSGSLGQAAISNNSRTIMLFTAGSTVRFGFELPTFTAGSSTAGSAVAADFKKGIPLLPVSTWLTYNIGYGVNRILYFTSGSPGGTVSIVQI